MTVIHSFLHRQQARQKQHQKLNKNFLKNISEKFCLASLSFVFCLRMTNSLSSSINTDPAFMWPLINLCNGENIELKRQEERSTQNCFQLNTGRFRACLHDQTHLVRRQHWWRFCFENEHGQNCSKCRGLDIYIYRPDIYIKRLKCSICVCACIL